MSKDERKFQQGYLGKQAFWEHVVKTFHDYHTKKETMDRCWRLKSAVIKSILDANGWMTTSFRTATSNANQPFKTTSPWLER